MILNSIYRFISTEKKFLLLVFLLFSFNIRPLFSQSIELPDSLRQLISNAPDTCKYKILKNYAWKMRALNPVLSYYFGNQALKLAIKNQMSKEQASIHNYLGVFKRNQSHYSEALNHYIRALHIADSLNFKQEKGYAHNNIGEIYRILGQDSLAIENYIMAVNIFEKLGRKKGIAYCYFQLCLLHIGKKNYDLAFDYNEKSLKIREELKDWRAIIGNYRNTGNIFEEKGDSKNAELYYRKALKLAENNQKETDIGLTSFQLGKLLFNKGRNTEAIQYFKKAIESGKKTNSLHTITISSEKLSEVYETIGNQKEALKYYQLFKSASDTLNSIKSSKSLTRLSMQFEFDKLLSEQEKETQQKIQKEKSIQHMISFGLIVMILIAFLIFRSFNIKRKAYNLLQEKTDEINKQKSQLIEINKQLQASENHLKQANNTKDKFFSIIAHDLKNPFNYLLGFSELLLKNHREWESKKREKIILIIYDSAKNTYNLLENLLTWSRAQSNSIEYTPKKIEIKSLINEIVVLHKPLANNKHISILTKNISEKFVFVDKNMINMVLRNLLTNAIKFTPINGQITISTSVNQEQTFMSIAIQDNGIGIPSEKINKLFRIDQNNSTNGTEGESGTGLGLILCKEFIEKNGGEIKIESKIEKGSTFSFTTPLDKESKI